MQIKINHVKTTPERITITKWEYTQLSQKAALYDDYKAAQRQRGQKLQALLTAEQRSDKARKAAIARWNKNNMEEQ